MLENKDELYGKTRLMKVLQENLKLGDDDPVDDDNPDYEDDPDDDELLNDVSIWE